MADVIPEKNDYGDAILRDHMLNNVCDGNEATFPRCFGFFAHMMQRLHERIGVAIVLPGLMGTGKTKVGGAMGSLMQRHSFLVDDRRYVTGQLSGRVNAHQPRVSTWQKIP